MWPEIWQSVRQGGRDIECIRPQQGVGDQGTDGWQSVGQGGLGIVSLSTNNKLLLQSKLCQKCNSIKTLNFIELTIKF